MSSYSRWSPAFAGALLLLSLASPAQAAKYFDFTISGAGVSASGQITTGDAGSPYALTGIIGSLNGDAITGLSGYAGADNLLYFPGAPYVDFSGISFSTATLGDWGLGWTGSAYGIVDSVSDPSGACCGITPLDVTITAVPEPAVWTTMLLGFFGVGFMLRKTRNAATLATV